MWCWDCSRGVYCNGKLFEFSKSRFFSLSFSYYFLLYYVICNPIDHPSIHYPWFSLNQQNWKRREWMKWMYNRIDLLICVSKIIFFEGKGERSLGRNWHWWYEGFDVSCCYLLQVQILFQGLLTHPPMGSS